MENNSDWRTLISKLNHKHVIFFSSESNGGTSDWCVLDFSFQRNPSPLSSRRFPPPSSSCGECSSWARPSSAPPSGPPQHCHCCCCLGLLRSGQFWTVSKKERNAGKKVNRAKCSEAPYWLSSTFFVLMQMCISTCMHLQFVQFLVHFWVNEQLCLTR